LRHALDMIKGSDVKSLGLKVYPQAIEVYEQLGDHKEALRYSKIYSQAIKEYNNDEVEKAVLVNNFKYESEQLNRKNEVSRLENEVLSTKLERRKITVGLLAGLLLLTSILFYLMRRHLKNKERLAEEIRVSVLAKKEKLYLEKEMEALRAQMNPHFLFNSLNSINHYILHEEPRAASSYLTKFSKLMRSILSNSKKRYVSLEEELKAMRLYTEIENVRFENRFTYQERIHLDVDIADVYLPPMLIQPFIENAVKHAFTGLDRECIIKLEVINADEALRLEISDNGIGRTGSSKLKGSQGEDKRSYGLEITRDRLDLISKLYDFSTSMDIEDLYDDDGASTGTKVNIEIPILYKTALD